MTDLVTQSEAIEDYFNDKIEVATRNGNDLADIREYLPDGLFEVPQHFPVLALESSDTVTDQMTVSRDESFLEIIYVILEANVDRAVGARTVKRLGKALAQLFLTATDYPDAVAELDAPSIRYTPDAERQLLVCSVTFRVRFQHLRS